MQFAVRAGTAFKVTLVWTDPPGVPLVNDLDLRVIDPAGSVLPGNGQPDPQSGTDQNAKARKWRGVRPRRELPCRLQTRASTKSR